jgi:hypothetical protein
MPDVQVTTTVISPGGQDAGDIAGHRKTAENTRLPGQRGTRDFMVSG